MHLQELIENLFTRDWGAVLIEIAILMIGIYLGLRANKWNDARKKAADGHYYAHRLLDELTESMTRLDKGIAAGRSTMDATLRAQKAILDASIDVDHPKEFIDDFRTVNFMEEVDVVDGAIEELRVTGKLGVIGNRAIREGVSRYYRTLQSARAQEEVSNQGWTMALANIYREVDATLKPDHSPIFSLEVSNLNGNHKLARALFAASVYQYGQIKALERLRLETLALRTLIEQDLT